MPSILSKDDVTRSWEALQAINSGLPRVLRDPQRDAIFWLAQGKHVVLCVGTGEIILVELPKCWLSYEKAEWSGHYKSHSL